MKLFTDKAFLAKNIMGNSTLVSTVKKKFKLTTLQVSALIILPLFIFALTIKIKERQTKENTTENAILNVEEAPQYNYSVQTVSQSVAQEDESVVGSAK